MDALSIKLLTGSLSGPYDNEKDFVHEVAQGKLARALSHTLVADIFKAKYLGNTNLDEFLNSNILEFIQNSSEDQNTVQKNVQIFSLGVCCLQFFIQNNWLGPVEKELDILQLSDLSEDKKKAVTAAILESLSEDGEAVYDKCRGIIFLYLAKHILTNYEDCFQNIKALPWWQFRCLMVQQALLDDRSPTIKHKCLELIQKIVVSEPLATDDNLRELFIQFNLEAGYCCIKFYEYNAAHEHFVRAQKLSGINVALTGALGRRTKFQENSKAQLLLKVTRDNRDEVTSINSEIENLTFNLPKNLNLDDDTVHEQVQLEDKEAKYSVNMSPLEQAVVLGLMENYRRSRAHHERLTEEELEAYIDCVLAQCKNWNVAVHALCLRSSLQKSSSRRVERSMRQLEELVNQCKREEPSLSQRLPLYYCCHVQPIWQIQKQVATLLIALGAIGAATEIYEQLEMWEDVVQCYQRMGKIEKAETLIRDQLKIKETANLWCFLGDVTGDIQHYEKAWEFSNHKSARAMRCMGYLYFSKEQFSKSLECFEKSLEINSLQVPVWFTCGCTAMSAKEFKKAVRAFKKCVQIDDDNFEAWNNMASSYVQLKEKSKALKALEEALKYNYENWRLWENILIVSADVGDFRTCIRAYNKLMDLKDKWEDEEVLGVLTKAVIEGYADNKGNSASVILKDLLTLFGRITAKITSNGQIWRFYAALTEFAHPDNADKREMVLQFLQKSHRCTTQDPKWEQTKEKCEKMAKQALSLSEVYEKCSEKAVNSSKSIQILSSCKLMLKGVLSKIKLYHTDKVTDELDKDVQSICDSLDNKLQAIVTKITDLKGS